MGVRGIDELLAVLPPVATGSASAVLAGLGELVAIRHAPLGPDEVRALAEFWERTSAQVAAARLAVLEAINDRVHGAARAGVGGVRPARVGAAARHRPAGRAVG